MPNKNKGGFKPQAQVEVTRVPTQYRCAAGNEWKSITEFSKKQQQKVIGRGRVDAANTGMICKEHNQAQIKMERKCDICNMKKPLSDFSGRSLALEEFRCKQCTAWTDQAEPGVTPIPLGTGHVSVEEETAEKWKEPIHTSDFFDHENDTGVPISGPKALGLDTTPSIQKAFDQLVDSKSSTRASMSRPTASGTSSVIGENMSVTSSRIGSALPPHLQGRLERLTVDGDSTSASSKEMPRHSRPAVRQLPPHLRGRNVPSSGMPEHFQQRTVSVGSSVSTATTVRKEQQEAVAVRQISYNAWDPKGQKHKAIKNPTVMSSSVSAVSIAGDDDRDSNVIGDWENIPHAPEPQLRGDSKWPKSSELRIPMSEIRKQQGLELYGRQKFEPAADRHRRMAYPDFDDDSDD
ncbi:hypothetical protein NW762_003384 [Fusarium torreyae]|uniref:Stc1 domain-containing protein n=1 Tax=Fusarium torreyae TaxID=1237075 RepID=A0A9W8S8P0_9HYPO|nr:hypothetical protein NW762_003384 [Fusarium torreyae]